MATLQLSQHLPALKSVKGSGGNPGACLRAGIPRPLKRRRARSFLRIEGVQRLRPLEATAAEGELETPVNLQQQGADALVDQLLSLVENTDRGAALERQQHSVVAELVSKLERLNVPPEPLQSPLIFGEWDVSYCSNPTAPGGYYRSAPGRLLLTTEEMIQTIDAPDFVGNCVCFSLFGVIKGRVSLRGKLVPVDQKTIEITFESPFLKFGPFDLRYGGESRVRISVLYVDERVRLGRGSRGSVFVFKRRSSHLETSEV